MDSSILFGLFSVAAVLVGGIVWGIRLEGRVNSLRELFDQRDKYLDERHNEMKDELNAIKASILLVGTKIDQLLMRK